MKKDIKNINKMEITKYKEKSKAKPGSSQNKGVKSLNGDIIADRLQKERMKDQKLINRLIKKVKIPGVFNKYDRSLKKIERTMKTSIARIAKAEEKTDIRTNNKLEDYQEKLEKAKSDKMKKKIEVRMDKIVGVSNKKYDEFENKKKKVYKKYDLQKQILFL